MGKKTRFEDVACMALIYMNQATGNKIISYDKVQEFEHIINENLANMNSRDNYSFFYEESHPKLYFIATNEDGKSYLVIDPIIDLEHVQELYIGCLPLDLVVASQKENALEVIGLQLTDGKFTEKRQKILTKSDK